MSKPRVRVGNRRLHLPKSRNLRLAIGILLILLGMFGFLPILGFWMIPLGFLILSIDLPPVRRARRRIEVWITRKFQSTKSRNSTA